MPSLPSSSLFLADPLTTASWTSSWAIYTLSSPKVHHHILQEAQYLPHSLSPAHKPQFSCTIFWCNCGRHDLSLQSYHFIFWLTCFIQLVLYFLHIFHLVFFLHMFSSRMKWVWNKNIKYGHVSQVHQLPTVKSTTNGFSELTNKKLLVRWKQRKTIAKTPDCKRLESKPDCNLQKRFSWCVLSHVAPKNRATWCNWNFQTNFFLSYINQPQTHICQSKFYNKF